MRELELNEMDGISGAGSKIKKKCVKWESSAMHRCSKWKMIFSPWRLATFYDPAGGRRNP